MDRQRRKLKAKDSSNLLVGHLHRFAATTTAHGYLRLANTPSGRGKVMWLSVMGIAFIGFICHLAFNLQLYLAVPISTDIQNSQEPTIFPQVTVCGSFWSIDYDRYYKLNKLIKSTIKNILHILEKIDGKVTIDRYVMTLLPFFIKENAFVNFYELIVKCEFQSTPCHLQFFDVVWRPRSGPCLVFIPQKGNKNRNASTEFNSRAEKPKGRNPMTLKLDLLTFSLVSTLQTRAVSKDALLSMKNWQGLWVTIGPPGRYPPVQEALLVMRRKQMKLQFSVFRKIIRLKSNLSCNLDPSPLKVLDWHGNVVTWEYSSDLCLRLAQQKQMISQCSCVSEMFPRDIDQKDVKGCHVIDKRFLTLFQKEDKTQSEMSEYNKMLDQINQSHICHDRVLENFNDSEAGCKETCDYLVYKHRAFLHNIDLVDNKNPKILRQQYNATQIWLKKNGKVNLTEKDLGPLSSYIVKIAISTVNEYLTSVTQTYGYPLDRFLSNVASNFGLWLGVSVITIMEILELLVSFVVVLLKRLTS